MEENGPAPRTSPRWMPTHSATAAVYRGEFQFAYGVLTNVSRCGACIVTDSVLPPGMDVTLKLSFYSQPELIETAGRIVWNRRGKAEEGGLHGLQLHGVQFTQTPGGDLERLRQLLASDGFVTVYEPPSEFDRLQRELASELERLGSKLGRTLGQTDGKRGSA